METMNHPSDKRLPGTGVVFCDTVRRCRSPFILYIAVMLLLGPLGFAFNLMERGEDLMRYPWDFPSPAYCGCVIFLGASCVIPMVIFSYLNNRRALDVFHALPVKRETQFTGNILAGLFLLFVPYLAAILPVAALCDLSYRWNTIGFYSSGALWESNLLLVTVIAGIGLMLFMLMSFMMFCCSTVIESAGYFAIILFGYFGLIVGGSEMIGDMTFGYSDFGLTDFLLRFSPFSFVTDVVQNTRKQALFFLIQMLLVAALFWVLAFRRAIGRKSEQAGGYVYPPVYYIAAGGGAVVGTIVLDLLFSSGVKGLIFSVICGVLFYVILDSIRNRGLKNITRSLSTCGIVAVFFGVFVLCIHLTGTFGYENNIPSLKEISSVSVSSDIARLDSDFPLTDSDSIEQVLSVHHALVDNKETIRNRESGSLKNYDAFSFDDGEDAFSCGSGYVSISYTLKNGMTLKRSYQTVPVLLIKPLYEMAGSKAYAESIADTLDRLSELLKGQSGDSVLNVDLSEGLGCVGGSSRDCDFPDTGAVNFLSALAEDFRARPEGWFVSPDENPILSARFYLDGEDYNFNLYTIDQNVLSFLEKYGYCDKNGALILPEDEDTPVENADAYTIGILPASREREFSDFRNKSIFYFGGFLANNSGWGIDEENAVHFYSADDGLESPTIECSEYMMDKEMLKKLTGLVRLLGISDTPQNVLFINGSTYLIPEENLEKVEALLQSRTRAVG